MVRGAPYPPAVRRTISPPWGGVVREGFVAIALSALWGLAGLIITVIGVLVLVSAQEDSTIDIEGFAEFVGGSFAFVGGLVLVASGLGIHLGARLFRGRPRAGWTVALFGLFAAISALFLSSAIAVESGPDPGSIVMSGANTAVCVFVVLAALAARRG